MKRFISLLVALVLLVSMFALPTFALAEETTETPDEPETQARAVGFDVETFMNYIVANNKGYFVEMGKFNLNLSWTEKDEAEEGEEAKEKVYELLKDEEVIRTLFPGIHYNVLPDENLLDIEEYRFTLTYKPGDHAAEGATEKSETVLSTKHVTLPAANYFAAEKGWEFAGWLANVAYDGSRAENVLYRPGDQFSMPDRWDGDVEVVAQWRQSAEEGEELPEIEYTYDINDIICLEYCSPSDDPKNDNWTRVKAGTEITLNASGFWMFRFVVIDGSVGGTESELINNDDAVITPYNSQDFRDARLRNDGINGEAVYHWEEFTLTRYAVDTSNPEIALSSSMKTKMEDGLTVGTTYSIYTSLTITDGSSNTTTTYTVWRYTGANGFSREEGAKNDGEWIQIYDSATGEVVEGYESYITSSGTLNPQADDVTADGNYRYKVVYSVKDENGYFGVAESSSDENGDTDASGEFHPTMYLGVKLSTEGEQSKKQMEVWKIILFSIAGLSAVGIVVLLLIKPKQEVAVDSRISDADGAADNAASDDSGDAK